MKKKIISIVGIVGLPGSYGGFETLAENLIRFKNNKNISYEVYCEKDIARKQNFSFLDAKLHAVNLKANGISSILYDFISMVRASLRSNTVIILGPSAGIFIPLFRIFFPRTKFITNMAGLEWARSKWSFLAKFILKVNESSAAYFSNVLVADNLGLVHYIKKKYKFEPTFIPYGGDHVCNFKEDQNLLKSLGIHKKNYDIAIARAQEDNNIEKILKAYIDLNRTIVFISNWEKSEYGRYIYQKYSSYKNICLAGPFYNIDELQTLRKWANYYIHGHSAGGTNPTLVEAMWSKLPIIAFDNIFNRHTTKSNATFFSDDKELRSILMSIKESQNLDKNTEKSMNIAISDYSWGKVAREYESLL